MTEPSAGDIPESVKKRVIKDYLKEVEHKQDARYQERLQEVPMNALIEPHPPRFDRKYVR